MTREPEYVSIARALRGEVLDGFYDDDGSLPGNAAIAERFGVSMKTAGRAIQHLMAEGLLIGRPGMRPLVVPPERRATVWPMTGRYARAREGAGLVFATDIDGEVRKDTVRREWIPAPIGVAQLLYVEVGARIFHRASRTYVDGALNEVTSMHFPPAVIARVPRLESDERVQVVPLLEEQGYVVTRTVNEVRARHASEREQSLFDIESTAIMIEQSHGTYGADDEALEAVINVRPASSNVITFETFEGPDA